MANNYDPSNTSLAEVNGLVRQANITTDNQLCEEYFTSELSDHGKESLLVPGKDRKTVQNDYVNGEMPLKSYIPKRMGGKVPECGEGYESSALKYLENEIKDEKNAREIADRQIIRELENKANKSSVYTKDETNELIKDFATENYVDNAIEEESTQLHEELETKADKELTYTKEQVDEIIYNILPTDTASGSDVNFETDLALSIKSLEIDVNAKQDLHGYNNPWTGGNGKNKFDPESPVITGFISASGFSTANTKARTTYLRIKPNTTYTVSRIVGQRFVVATATTIPENGAQQTQYISRNTYSNLTITSGSEDVYMWIFFYLYDTDTLTEAEIFNSIQVEEGSSVSEWSPYENICPIESRNEITFDVNDNIEVIELGGSYYGGHFTQNKEGHRQFEVTHTILEKAVSDMNNSESYPGWRNSGAKNIVGADISSYFTGKLNIGNGYSINTRGSNDIIYLPTGTYGMTQSQWIAKYPDLIVQIVIPYAQSFIINLPDGEPIIPIIGTNNMNADTGNITVNYKVSVEQYINNNG